MKYSSVMWNKCDSDIMLCLPHASALVSTVLVLPVGQVVHTGRPSLSVLV